MPLTGVTKVTSGNNFGCALTVDHEVWCWGANFKGQLGYGLENFTKENETVPYAVKVVKGQQESKSGYLGNIVDLAAGQDQICAMTGDGNIYCWGDNTALELGDAFESERVHHLTSFIDNNGDDLSENLWAVPYPVRVPAPEGTKFTAMTKSGYWTHCALTDPEENEYNLWCWGDDIRGMVSGDNTQYRDKISENWAGKIRKPGIIYNTEDSWYWQYFAQNGDWVPMFGQPVTNVKKYTTNERSYVSTDDGGYEVQVEQKDIEMKRIRSVNITAFDAVLILTSSADDGVSSLYTDNNKDEASQWYLLTKEDLDGDKAARITTQTEESQEYIVTEKGRFIEFGNNVYGMMGTGQETSESGWKAEPLILKNSDRYQVKDISLNKRSVCALVTDNEASNPSVPGLWCWGSSTFGQLGYDNHDNNFSYTDTSAAWPAEGGNEYFDQLNRIQDTPVKVALKFSE